MLQCMMDTDKKNRILDVGGPDPPLTNQMLGEVGAAGYTVLKEIDSFPMVVY